MSNPDFMNMLKMMADIHQKKAQDYSSDVNSNPLENFERSNEIAEWFPDEYKSFGVLIGTKLARLGSLLSKKSTPLNESIEDSFLDLATYCVLMYSFYKKRDIKIETEIKTKECSHDRADKYFYCLYCNKLIYPGDHYRFDSLKDEFIRIKD